MYYCADSWFVIKLFQEDERALNIINDVREGKDWLFIPFTVLAETSKKFMQLGISKKKINEFFDIIEAYAKVRFVILDKNIANEAATISLTHKLPLLDAFVAATSKICECHILLSGDKDYTLLAKSKYIKVQSW
ncbi:MAG: PIN domain-containing protein [Nanoarchaeota archaeon]